MLGRTSRGYLQAKDEQVFEVGIEYGPSTSEDLPASMYNIFLAYSTR
jgi:hypothetical protein